MRITVIDSAGTASFVAPCSALQGLVAACAQNPQSLRDMLRESAPYTRDLEERVLSALAVFDEHNSSANLAGIYSALEHCLPQDLPAFRVLDERTREASLSPVRAGVVVFNLVDRRIIQIQNTYAEIRRRGRVRLESGGVSMQRFATYELPPAWSVVPDRQKPA